jgi:hypothetical protein
MGNKVLLVLLILIVVVFVALAVWGAGNNSQTGGFKQTGNPTTDGASFDPSGYKWIGSLGGWLTPKLDPKYMKPPDTTVNLTRSPSLTINVLPYSSNKLRQAKFTATPDQCAEILFTGQSSSTPRLNNQDSNSPENKKHALNFLVPEEGGTFIFKRRLVGACTVQLVQE